MNSWVHAQREFDNGRAGGKVYVVGGLRKGGEMIAGTTLVARNRKHETRGVKGQEREQED